MLECQGLFLCPWRRCPARWLSGWVVELLLSKLTPQAPKHAGTQAPGHLASRAVLDRATGRQLGLARWKAGRRWLGRRVIEVCETEDESLLCTLYRPWSPLRGWEVYDADERLIAAVYSRLIVDCGNYPLALVERPSGTVPGHFVSPDGIELAMLRPAPDGVALEFAVAVEGNPFAKMALLGAALVLV